MKFSRSRVLSTLLLFALAVAFSGVAEAQKCIVRAKSANTVRAEGLTEVVGDLELRCTAPDPTEGFGFEGDAIPEELEVAVELNTHITNTINDDRVVQMASTATDADAYSDGGITLTAHELDDKGVINTTEIAASQFGDGKLSDDGTTIEWEITSENVHLLDKGTNDDGFNLIISGIRANAAMVGNGEDVMANVLVGGTALNEAPMKLADVTTGLVVEVDDAEGVQCNDTEAVGKITLKEGFASAIMQMDSFDVTFTGVPEGVTVTVPDKVALAVDDPDTTASETEGSFILERTMGRTSGADDDGVLELSTSGAGSVRYTIGMTAADSTVNPAVEAMDSVSNTLNEEWATLTVDFEWDGGEVDLGSVTVYVSYHPTSIEGGDTFSIGGASVPRFMEDTAADTLLTIGDCTSKLFYPFVTSSSGYDTGIVVSNTSSATGSCMATYSGAGAPDDAVDVGEVMPGMQAIFLVSAHAEDFSGYLTVDCTTQSASGFAHVVDTSGFGGSQGYIAQ